MKLTLEADPENCGNPGPCPKIFRTDQGTLVIQGDRFPDLEGVPDSETRAEVPESMVLDWAIARLRLTDRRSEATP
jgi:hypothetical protein